MPRLPTRDDLGGLPSARSGRVIANFDTSAAGRGLANAGAAIESAGIAIGKMAGDGGGIGGVNQAQRFETNRKFLEFVSGQQQAYEDSKNTVDPGAFGFRELAQKQYRDAAKAFFATIPEPLKPEYDQKLFAEEDSLLSKARVFETDARTNFYNDEVNKGLVTIENNLFSNPGEFDKNLAKGLEFINSIPDESVSRIHKADLAQKWRTKAQLAALNGVTPQERIRLLGGDPDVPDVLPSAGRAQAVTRGISGDVRKVVSDAAAAYGVDPNALLTIAMIESGGNPNAKNPNSSAGGLFQFIDSTAKSYGLQNKFDPAQAADAAARLARDNSAALESALGRKPTTGELYLAHQQGIGGAVKLLSNPNAKAVDVVGADAVRLNGGTSDMTAGQFASLWLKKAGDTHVPDAVSGPQFDASRADPRFADLPYEAANKLVRAAQEEVSTQNRGMIETAVQDAPAAILNTGVYSGQMPTADQFIQAYGVQEGADRFTKFSKAVEVSKEAFNFRTMPEDEIQAAVTAARPTSSGPGAAIETARYETLRKAASDTIKARNADPSTYVRSIYPDVAQAWEAAAVSGDYSKALAATASVQEQLGIRNMRLLPEQIATQATAAFKDDKIPGEQRIAAVNSLIFSTTDPAQQRAVFEQLVEEGLPDTTEGAIEAFARGDKGAGRRLMEAAIIDPKDLPGTSDVKRADVEEEIQSKIMAEGKIGDIFYGLSDGTIENQERAIRDSKLLTNAVSLRIRRGETLDAAIDGAAKDLYGDVEAWTTGNFDVNVEILLPAGADIYPILDGLTSLLPNVRSRLEESLVVPSDISTSGGEKAVTEAVRSNYIDNVMAEGYFRNSGDGYVFIDPYVGAAIAGPDGKPLVFSDDDVLNAPPPVPKLSPLDQMPQHRVRTQEEIDVETYGEFAPMLEKLQEDEPAPEGPTLPSGGGAVLGGIAEGARELWEAIPSPPVGRPRRTRGTGTGPRLPNRP